MMEFEVFPNKKGSLPTLAKEKQNKKILMYVCMYLSVSIWLSRKETERWKYRHISICISISTWSCLSQDSAGERKACFVLLEMPGGYQSRLPVNGDTGITRMAKNTD